MKAFFGMDKYSQSTGFYLSESSLQLSGEPYGHIESVELPDNAKEGDKFWLVFDFGGSAGAPDHVNLTEADAIRETAELKTSIAAAVARNEQTYDRGFYGWAKLMENPSLGKSATNT